MTTKKSIIIVVGLVLISTTLAGAYLSVNNIELPDVPVTLNAVDGTTSYFIIILSNVPSGNDVSNGTYPGWCADRSVTMVRGVDHSVTLYDSYDPDLPAPFQSPNWDKVNWILNHKNSYAMMDLQDAIWYLIDKYPWASISMNAQGIVANANASGDGFIPESGEIIAIVAVPEVLHTDAQCTFIELVMPGNYEGLTPGYWKNHLGAWHTYTPTATVASVFTLPSILSSLGGNTLLEGLQYKGGNKDIGAARILLRAAVAALLNAADPDITYPLTDLAIIQEVNAALSQGRTAMLILEDTLDGYNNLGAD